MSKLFILLVLSAILSIDNKSLFCQKAQSKVGLTKIWCGNEITPKYDYLSQNQVSNSGNIDGSRLENPSGEIVVPVVFHILYHPSVLDQNVTDQAIDYQLDRLNEDFRGMVLPNISTVPQVWQGLVGNMKVRFKRACINPTGGSTNGIIRKQLVSPTEFHQVSSAGAFPYAQLSAMGGDDAWPTDTYLNIWVCDVYDYLGWGMYPWDRANSTTFLDLNNNSVTEPNTKFDGIVLDYTNFPPASQGGEIPIDLSYRLATHEAGHWLGVYHIFSCDGPGSCNASGDFVCDTPPQNIKTFGCPTFPVSGGGCAPNPPGVMFMNFMDYTDSRCMRFFTSGQVARARSFFSQSGPPGSRFPFLQNYFSIRRLSPGPHTVINNIITININNPSCETVQYTFTGPVTEISHDNQKIIFSVPCETSGTINLTIRNITPSGALGNYIDDNYDYSFVNPSCTGAWPKAYGTMDGLGSIPIFKNYLGDILFNTNLIGTNSIFYNHSGVIPSPNQVYTTTFHYTSSGITNWLRPYDWPIFSFRSGVVAMTTGYDNSNIYYVNGSTGNSVPSPISLLPQEVIVAEASNGDVITYNSNNELCIHALSGNIICSNIFISQGGYRKYNILNDELIEIYYNLQGDYIYKKYHYNGVTIQQVFSVTLPALSFYPQSVAIDNNGRYYFFDNNGELFYYNPINNSILSANIQGIVNQNLIEAKRNNYYTSDLLLVYNRTSAIDYIYALDFLNMNSKKISAINIAGDFWYENDGNNIFIAGIAVSYVQQSKIGTQIIPALNELWVPVFITKLNLESDFDFQRESQAFDTKGLALKNSLVVQVSPNPASTSLVLRVLENGNTLFSTYNISISNQIGKVFLQKNLYVSGSSIDISSLKTGMYFVTITNKKGQTKSVMFSKL